MKKKWTSYALLVACIACFCLVGCRKPIEQSQEPPPRQSESASSNGGADEEQLGDGSSAELNENGGNWTGEIPLN